MFPPSSVSRISLRSASGLDNPWNVADKNEPIILYNNVSSFQLHSPNADSVVALVDLLAT